MIFNKVIERISILKNRCRSSECSIIGVLFRMLMFRLVYKKNILTSPKVKIKNIKNIKFNKNSNLIVGLSNVNHVNNNSICYINNRGEMHVSGNVFIAKSVRVDIADSSKIILNDCYIGPETDLILALALEKGVWFLGGFNFWMKIFIWFPIMIRNLKTVKLP